MLGAHFQNEYFFERIPAAPEPGGEGNMLNKIRSVEFVTKFLTATFIAILITVSFMRENITMNPGQLFISDYYGVKKIYYANIAMFSFLCFNIVFFGTFLIISIFNIIYRFLLNYLSGKNRDEIDNID